MRVQPVGARPGHDLAGDLGGERRVDEQAPDAPRAGRRHRPDQPALVADDRAVSPSSRAKRIALETIRPVTSETRTPRRRRGRDRRPGVRADDQVVADERAVDVERDQLDGQDRRGCRCGWARQDDARRAAIRASVVGVSRVSRAGSGRRAAGRRGRSRPCSDQPGSRSATALHDRLALVGPDLEERDAALGQRVRQPLEQPTDDRQAIGAAVEGQHRLERGGHRQARHRIVTDVRQVREHDVERAPPGRRRPRQQVGLPERDRHPRRRGRPRSPGRGPARRARGPWRGSRRTRAHHAGAGRRPGRRRSRPLPSRRRRPGSAGVPADRGAAPSRGITSASASSTSRSVSGRGMSARRSTLNASP